MKESLIGSVVSTVTGTVESTTNALTGTTSTETSSSYSDTSTSSSTASASTTSTPKTTAPTPSTTTSSPLSTTATPALTTSTPRVTTADSTTDSGISSSVSNPASSASTSSNPAEATSLPTIAGTTPSSSTTTTSSIVSYSSSTSRSAMNDSDSSLPELRGSQNYASVSIANQTGSSSHGDGEAGVTNVARGLNTGSIVGLVLGALGAFLLLVLLVSWCLRRRRKQLMNSINHVRLGATGDIPVFNTRGTERFETSSTSVSFGPFHTARSASDETERPGLWEDEVITAMRIPLEKLTTTKLLSSGGYGEVYRGVYREDIVAIKVLLPDKQKDLEQINAFLAEIKMMATVDHPCIVRFLGVAWDSLSDLSAVMEFMEGGDLRSVLDRFQQEQRPRGFDLDKARIALQTAQALTYLHSLDPTVLHRDLKSRNILLTSELDAKVSDFGVARKYSFTSMTAAVGTSLWMAPEVMLGDRYDASADIFSFGVALSEMDSHLYPYAEARTTNSGQRVPDAALLQLVVMGRVSVNFSSNAPAELVELGRACVSLNPMARPSASEVHYRLQLIMHSYEMYTL
ncbi:TKL protein kinase [Phytophthora nicotianae P1976]|uniref:TKL protein kinase n=1 Tax=Phytophthora nicotianae P1976 TaxID=1317066 RepID=A0A080ZGY9_PHYNI|nr:TKL protein kinase [Phytophthora nicotianae P1976]